MPLTELNTRVARDSVRNFLTAQERGFRCTTDQAGNLVEDNSLGRIKGRLVAWVERSSGRSGGSFGRVVKALVGAERYAYISRQIKNNRDASINNMLHHFIPGVMGEDRKNQDLRAPVEDEKRRELTDDIKSRLENAGRLSSSDFETMAQGIKHAIDQRRGAARQRAKLAQLLEGILDKKELTPVMQALNRDERRVAVLAINNDLTAAQALDRAQAPEQASDHDAGSHRFERDTVDLHKVAAVIAEKQSLDAALDAAHADIKKGLLPYYDTFYHGGMTLSELKNLSEKTRAALEIGELDEVTVEMETSPDIEQVIRRVPGNVESEHELVSVEANFKMNKAAYAELLMQQDGLTTGLQAFANLTGVDSLKSKVRRIIKQASRANNSAVDKELSGLSDRLSQVSSKAYNIDNQFALHKGVGRDGSDLVQESRALLDEMSGLYQIALDIEKRLGAGAAAPREQPAPDSPHYRSVGEEHKHIKQEALRLQQAETRLEQLEGELDKMLRMAETPEKLQACTSLYVNITELENELGLQETGADLPDAENSSHAAGLDAVLSDCAGFREQVVEALIETNQHLDPAVQQSQEQTLNTIVDMLRDEQQRTADRQRSKAEMAARVRNLEQQIRTDIDRIITPASMPPSLETEV